MNNHIQLFRILTILLAGMLATQAMAQFGPNRGFEPYNGQQRQGQIQQPLAQQQRQPQQAQPQRQPQQAQQPHQPQRPSSRVIETRRELGGGAFETRREYQGGRIVETERRQRIPNSPPPKFGTSRQESFKKSP
jgi:hypothetical protein